MRGRIPAFNHLHPHVAIIEKATLVRFASRIFRPIQRLNTHAFKEILERIPGQFMRVLESLNQPLLLKLAQLPLTGKFDCAIELAESLNEMIVPLYPANVVFGHGIKLKYQLSGSSESKTCAISFKSRFN